MSEEILQMAPSEQARLPRASFEELMIFCNAVRKAGGADPIDALLPATPRNAHACLLAVNLNFDCGVSTAGHYEDNGEYKWAMFVRDEIAVKLHEALGLEILNKPIRGGGRKALLLPREIGRIARAYDHWYGEATNGEFSARETAREINLSGEFAQYLAPEIFEAWERKGVKVIRDEV